MAVFRNSRSVSSRAALLVLLPLLSRWLPRMERAAALASGEDASHSCVITKALLQGRFMVELTLLN